eukprot:TRINITY_DN3226_c0_g1_i1.p1 TRINITY_DN3226_c0_g1~~TRINITY_DN3226_c0_g1_i1.p1  ORF type:complete len:349 (-),score=88.62 TRINITY_DN3226_c0_g1_i1:149-1195(-)
MGCVQSASEKTDESKRIDELLKQEQKAPPNTKVLLLGTGEAGKTTFLKQIIFLTKEGDVKDDHRLQLKNIGAMKENILNGMNAMVKKALDDDLIRKSSKEIAKAITTISQAEDLGPEEAQAVKLLWEQKGVKEVWEKRLVLLPTCLDYFLNDIDRVTAADFYMTPDDILRVRHKTTGVQWYDIPPKGKDRGWTFVDVGGQQSERRKWIHAFEDVNAVLYLSSLDSYDMVLEEDQTTSRIEDDIRLFGEVICTPYLPHLWIFFQNKSDIFEKKIKIHPLSDYFNDVDKEKEEDFEYAVNYLRAKFVEKIPDDRKITFHVTCALDTNKFEQIFKDIRTYILAKALGSLGL